MNVFLPTVSPDGKTMAFSYSEQDFGVGELQGWTWKAGKLPGFCNPERHAQGAREPERRRP